METTALFKSTMMFALFGLSTAFTASAQQTAKNPHKVSHSSATQHTDAAPANAHIVRYGTQDYHTMDSPQQIESLTNLKEHTANTDALGSNSKLEYLQHNGFEVDEMLQPVDRLTDLNGSVAKTDALGENGKLEHLQHNGFEVDEMPQPVDRLTDLNGSVAKTDALGENGKLEYLQHNGYEVDEMPQPIDRLTDLNGGVAKTDALGENGKLEYLQHNGYKTDDLDADITIYPNPMVNQVRIKYQSQIYTDSYSVIIKNLNGKVMYQQSNIHTDQMEINTQSWEKGCYLVSLTSKGKQQLTRRVCKM
jgi:hypothetical protein